MHLELLSLFYRSLGWYADSDFSYLAGVLTSRADIIAWATDCSRIEDMSRFEIVNRLDGLEKQLDKILKKGWRVIYPTHPDFPKGFSDLELVPSFLCYAGSACWHTPFRISIVGSREPSREAIEWMRNHLPDFFQKYKMTSVSGAARGIDQETHLVSIASGLPSVAFLPSGLSQIYPFEFSEIAGELLDHGGAIVSEYLPDVPMRKFHFEERNRLVAAISNLLLVVQARARSGTSITYRHARNLHRNCAAIPWGWNHPLGEVPNQMIYDGAQMIRDKKDIQQWLNLEFERFV